MKIELNIPDWVDEEKRGIWIMAGVEPVAYKMPWNDNWYIKVSRCSSCGKCCLGIRGSLTRDKSCQFLNDENTCSKGVERPWVCCVNHPKNKSYCTVKYEAVAIK